MSDEEVTTGGSPNICLYITGDDWDHYLLFAMTEINSGMYNSTLGNMKFGYKILYADPYSQFVEGEAQDVFSANYKDCHAFVGPAWTTQLSAIGEWAGLKQKPIVSGGATSPIFAQDNFGWVSRSIPSDFNVLDAFAQIIVEYKLNLINVVYANDEYGVSIAEALTELSGVDFEIQLIRSFESADNVEDIGSILDDLEASPTSITFLGMTIIQTADFLNAAGARGMHDTHLWLSPNAVQVASDLDPPSTGGLWGISYGEELTEEAPLAQRYLAKDPAPHIEAQQYGFDENYTTLTYWGSYAYDAVLAAASGLAAAANVSDGEEVLRAIRGLSLNITNTGNLEMDEHGDRVGARIPIFFVKPDGEAEEFAVYDGALEYKQAPLWPGGLTVQPKLIREVSSGKRVGAIVGGVLGSLVVLLGIVFLAYFKRSKKTMEAQKQALLLRESELKELKSSIQNNIGTTQYADAVEYVASLLENDGLDVEKDKLKLVKSCLLRSDDSRMHIPKNLNADEEAFIMKEYAGINVAKITRSLGSRRLQLQQKSSRNFDYIKRQSFVEASIAEAGCLPEFAKLDVAQQEKLFGLLSFSSLQKWDFNIFDVAEIDAENTLLFVSWAVICSPYSQIAMAKELRKAGAEVSDEIQGYAFTDIDFTIDGQKLVNYIRLIQDGYLDTPYHNRIHAADVVQTLNSLLQMAIEKFPFEKEDLFLILISAVVHDVKHPGRNNAFQVNSFSELALNWNDISVLESEHVSFAFKCMIKEEDSHFIQNADPSKLQNVRKKMIDAVLHTDMTKHFAGVSKIKAAAAGKSWDQLEPDVRWEVLMYMLHMADISNPAKGDPMFKLWTDRCLAEFFQQGDKEREMDLPVSPNCDRNTTKRPDSQIGFIKFVVRPAYEVLGEIIPAVKDNILPQIERNLVYWDEEKKLDETV